MLNVRCDDLTWLASDQHASVVDTSEVLQQLDLPQRALGQNLLAKNIGDLLDGNAFGGLHVGGSAVGAVSLPPTQVEMARRRGLPNDAVRTLTKLLGHIVAFVNYEFLVEDIEDLAA